MMRQQFALRCALLTLSVVLAGCDAAVQTTEPERQVITVVSELPLPVFFGQVIAASFQVTTGGRPQSGVAVSFIASAGVALPSGAYTDERGIASTQWSVAESPESQALSAWLADGPSAGFSVMPKNAWSVNLNSWPPPATYRLADDPAAGTSSSWANTPLGSPPQLIVSCEGATSNALGTTALTVSHPNLKAVRSTVTWTLEGEPPVTEEWETWQGNGLRPASASNTYLLVLRMADRSRFTVRFRDAVTNVEYTASFGTAGLRLQMAQVLYDCTLHDPDPYPWDY